MTSLTRLLVAGAMVVAATLGVTQAAFAQIPSDIAVPEGNKLHLKAHAVGIQIYSCNGSAWTFVAPRADLLDRRGKLLGTHFAGPTWQAKDGSKVVGARAGGVNVDPTAIDWLLLSATSTAEGPRRGDLLADTTFIQRVNTTGGLIPPAADCHAGTAGTVKEIPYTADYHFWKARHRCKDR
jgi:Protein of unknown function (DUF3455)